MDGISFLQPLAPELQEIFYERGNAYGWLARNCKIASTNYHLAGRLYLAKSGWLLLSVPNAFVRGLFSALTAPGAELPTTGLMNVPNVPEDILNAHIAVMTADEVAKIGADKINERGHTFNYGLGAIRDIPVSNIDGVSKIWAAQIVSPALSALRKSYGLAPLMHGDHAFHITIAARRKRVLGNNEVSKFDTATGRGELKAAADDKTTYDCSCSGPCMCPDTCVCKKHGKCGHVKKAEELPWRERVEVYTRHPQSGKIYGGVWDGDKSFAVPGGGIDPGETPEQAALRELEEETGIKATNPTRLPIPPVDQPWSDAVRAEKAKIGRGGLAGSRTHFVMVDFMNKLRNKQLDKWDATKRQFYAPTKALALMQGKQFMAPAVAAGRMAALKHIIEQARQKTAADPEQTILVSGHSGAGKSTLAKALSEKLKIPLHQIDSHPDQKAFFAVNKDGQETVAGSPEYEAFQKLRKRTAEETLAGITGPAIVEGAQLSGMSPEQLALYKKRIFVHTPLKQLLKQRLERQRSRQIAKGNEWTPELEAKKQRIGRAIYDSQNDLMAQYAKIPGTLKYTTHKDDINELLANLKKTAADLLPGGEADNMPDSKFPPKALAEGKTHEHEHTNNDQIAKEIAKDHLQEDPAYYKKQKKLEKIGDVGPTILKRLREAKAHSDAKRYDKKHAILRELMLSAPNEWYVDDPVPRHMGITHDPTKFRFHADPVIIPPGVKVKAKAAAAEPYLAQLKATPIAYNQNDSVWRNFVNHLIKVKANGDSQLNMQTNSASLLRAMDPSRQQKYYTAIGRGEFPDQPKAITNLIQRHGGRVLSAL